MKIQLGPILLLCFTALAGCSLATPEDDAKTDLQYYNVILHPPNLMWDDAEQKLSGNITISVLPPDYKTSANPTYRVEDLQMKISFLSSDPPPTVENSFSHFILDPSWRFSQTLKLSVGETGIWNFSAWPKDLHSKPRAEGIDFDVSYRYDIYDKQTDKLEHNLVLEHNPCLDVVAGGIQRRFEGELCAPFEFRKTIDTRYYMAVDFTKSRAVELWNTWDNIWTPLIPIRDYLNHFDYKTAKIKYFKGEVSCGSCNREGYDYQRMIP